MASGLKTSLVAAALKMPPSLARVAIMLCDQRVVSAQDVEKKQKFSEGCGRVYISRLRQFLGEHYNIEVRGARGSGYYLNAEDRDWIMETVAEFNS